jgi:hypothetical protein
MWLVLLLSIVGVAVIVMLIYSGVRAAVWKQFDQTETAAANAGQAVGSSRAEQTSPGTGTVQDQKIRREEVHVGVPASTGSPSSGAVAWDNARIEAGAPPIGSSKTSRESAVAKEMWADSHYCWVVLCKNHWFHLRKNLFFRHRIPLAETDPIAPRPTIDHHFRVRCDECAREYFYKPSEVMRFELELPETFTPHPLFRMF